MAIFDDRDNWHIDAMRVIESNSGPNILPSQVMAEITYILESRIGSLQLLQFLDDVESGGFTLDCLALRTFRAFVNSCADTQICPWVLLTRRLLPAPSGMAAGC